MSKIFFAIAVIAAFAIINITCIHETPSEQCPGLQFENLRDNIQVKPCGTTECKLHKGTNTTVIFRFKTKKEIKSLTNKVFATINGLPFPFIGVTGTTACEHLIHAEDGKAVSCPLAANQEYVYTNIFHIENFYPQTPLRVHWSISDGENDVICFEVPAVIIK